MGMLSTDIISMFVVSALIILLCAEKVVGCIEKERQALVTFKHSLTDPSNRLSSWVVGSDCCDWYGVTCDDTTGRVVVLGLGNNGETSMLTSSEVSPSLLELEHLRHLDLSGNNFQNSEIPNFIGNFRELEILDLSGASFAGEIPPSLGNISTLHSLYLRSLERLKVNTSNWLSHLSALHSLDMSYVDLSQISSDLPQILGSLPSLSGLWLHNCNLKKFPLSLSSSSSLSSLLVLSLGTNGFHGQIPSVLRNLTDLSHIDLSDNSFSGNIPDWLSELTSLGTLRIRSNRFHGQFPFALHNLTNLIQLDLSENSFNGQLPHWLSLFKSLFVLDVSGNKFHGQLPNALQNSTHLNALLLESNDFSGLLPDWLINMNSLQYLLLDNNHFHGRLPNFPLPIRFITISNNSISGSILQDKMLGNNMSSLCELRFLKYIDLSNNDMEGEIPTSIGNLSFLSSLRLSNNKFHGGLPLSLKYCKNLVILDLAANRLSGNIPSWIGELLSLRILKLKSNMFDGVLNPQLCHLSNILVLDLSQNNFSGPIPPCLKNFTCMRFYCYVDYYYGMLTRNYQEKVTEVIKGSELEYSTTLKYLVNLDLSSNYLVGHIPVELFSLLRLTNVNLSNNHLSGDIPQELGRLKFLESLDLSRNQLTGVIPGSISGLSFISNLCFAYNNLSGQIPSGNQLQTFGSSTYMGNAELCGIPLEKKCLPEVPSQVTNGDAEETKESQKVEFIIGIIIGYVVGFWGVCGVLFFKKSFRDNYFRFVQNMHDKLLM